MFKHEEAPAACLKSAMQLQTQNHVVLQPNPKLDSEPAEVWGMPT